MGTKDKVNYSRQEWLDKGTELFGDDYSAWKFVCPKCGNIASGEDFKNAGADVNDMYSCCIGRYTKDKGCDWAAFGLFDICSVHVDGIPVFDFATSKVVAE